METLAYLVVKEFSNQAFSITVSHIINSISTLPIQSTDQSGKKIKEQLQKVIPIVKLQLINGILKDFDLLKTKSLTIEILMDSLNEIGETIRTEINKIAILIAEHEGKWFSKWRNLDVSFSIEKIKKACQMLDDIFEIMKTLLPSCMMCIQTVKQITFGLSTEKVVTAKNNCEKNVEKHKDNKETKGDIIVQYVSQPKDKDKHEKPQKSILAEIID